MSTVEILPAINPEKVPKAHHKELNVPVMALPSTPRHMPKAVPTCAAGKAPRTHVPMGFTRPILSPPMMVDKAYMG